MIVVNYFLIKMDRYTLDELNELENFYYYLYMFSDIVEIQTEIESYIMHFLQDKYPELSEINEKAYDEINCEYCKKLNEYLVSRWPGIDFAEVSSFIEYPDLSSTYTSQEIFDTFNSYTDIQYYLEKLFQANNTEYYITEKSYGANGNVINKHIIDRTISNFSGEYIYENEEKREYLWIIRSHKMLILFDRKIC